MHFCLNFFHVGVQIVLAFDEGTWQQYSRVVFREGVLRSEDDEEANHQ